MFKRLVSKLGWSVHRWPPNAFDGMWDQLKILSRMGFRPDLIIDCGANIGQWTNTALSVFPKAMLHAIEPQAGCGEFLHAIAHSRPNVTIHRTAVTDRPLAIM